MLRKIINIILASAILLSVAGCSADLSSTAEESRTVMSVDGYDVPYEMYRYSVLNRLNDKLVAEGIDPDKFDKSSLDGEKLTTIADEVKKDSVKAITDVYSVFTAAKDNGIDPFGERINTLTDMKMEEIRAGFENDREYLKSIKKFNMTDNVYSILTRSDILSELVYEECLKTGEIDSSDEAVIAYMTSDEAVRVKQILVSFERHSEEEASSLAEKIYGELQPYVSEDGIVDEEQFDLFTDKYGENLFMFKNRDGYYICKGYADEKFEEISYALEVGHMSEPVRMAAGYGIMMRAEIDPAYVTENVKTLKDIYLTGVMRGIFEGYSANVKIEYADEFEKLDVYSMK